MDEVRWLDWEGCRNVRDLGGLPTLDGRRTRPGALVRTDSVHHLTEAGWTAAWDHGVRTVIDLRHAREVDEAPPTVTPPAGVTTVARPVEDEADTAFVEHWGPQLATPHYYADALDRFAGRVGAVVTTVAAAPPGGVVIHCVIGRDRTGMVIAVLLHLLGVAPEVIAADHALSYQRVRGIHGDAEGDLHDGWEAAHAAALDDLLTGWDPGAYLRGAGVGDAELEAVRIRLLDG